MTKSGENDSPGRLVGFVSLKENSETTSAELRTFLKERLPAHLLPNVVEVLDEIPKLPNGKTDRKTLSSHQLTGAELPDANQDSLTATELALIEIWESILDVTGVNREDDFFSLGGHSLLATRLIATVNEELDCNMTVADLFDFTTVSGLAEQIDSARKS